MVANKLRCNLKYLPARVSVQVKSLIFTSFHFESQESISLGSFKSKNSLLLTVNNANTKNKRGREMNKMKSRKRKIAYLYLCQRENDSIIQKPRVSK